MKLKVFGVDVLLKGWSESAREAAVEARRAGREAAKEKAEDDRVNQLVVAAKIGKPVFDEKAEARQTALVEQHDAPGTVSDWGSTTVKGATGLSETQYTATHSSGATAKIREMENPFRPKLQGVFAHVRVDHPKTGVNEKWFDTGSKERIVSEAKAWARTKLRGE